MSILDALGTAGFFMRLRPFCTIDEISGCWLWHGSTAGKLPLVYVDKTHRRSARRLIWEKWTGKAIPKDKFPAMKCTEAMCIHPQHMHLVPRASVARRSADWVARCTVAQRKRSDIKLSMTKAREIRQLVAWGIPKVEIQRKYDISRTTVDRIVSGRLWREATPWQGLSSR